MWNVNPKFLCNKHLLGEHVEMHMYVGCILKRTSLKGYIDKGLVEVHNIRQRHDELVQEMISRKINHKSELKNFNSWIEGNVDGTNSIKELCKRCKNCKERIYKK